MKRVKILGGGCQKCNTLETNTIEALKELNIEYQIEHIKDFATIASYGVMSTPALVIDDEILVEGQVATKQDIINLLK